MRSVPTAHSTARQASNARDLQQQGEPGLLSPAMPEPKKEKSNELHHMERHCEIRSRLRSRLGSRLHIEGSRYGSRLKLKVRLKVKALDQAQL